MRPQHIGLGDSEDQSILDLGTQETIAYWPGGLRRPQHTDMGDSREPQHTDMVDLGYHSILTWGFRRPQHTGLGDSGEHSTLAWGTKETTAYWYGGLRRTTAY